MKGQKTKYVFLTVGALIILWSIIRMIIPEKSWNFKAEDLKLEGEAIWFEENVINENKAGWYIDNSMEYGDTFARTPKIDCP